jgi:hypothetical protein
MEERTGNFILGPARDERACAAVVISSMVRACETDGNGRSIVRARRFVASAGACSLRRMRVDFRRSCRFVVDGFGGVFARDVAMCRLIVGVAL